MCSFLRKIFQYIKNHQDNVDQIIEQNSKPKDVAIESKHKHKQNKPKKSELETQIETLFNSLFEKFPSNEKYNRKTRLAVAQVAATMMLIEQQVVIPEQIKDKVIDLLQEPQLDYKKLQEAFLLYDLQWNKFDECCALCIKNNLYPYAYQFLKKRPVIPDTFEQALLFVRINQLKKLLKTKIDTPLPKNKIELYQLFAQHFTLDDMGEILEERLEELEQQFKSKVKKHKIDIFGFTVYQLAQNLAELYYHRIVANFPRKVQIGIPSFLDFYDDVAFIKQENLKCIDDNRQLIAVPPLFPGDYRTIEQKD
ncbi:hypothetical protein [Avibacterium paragallinarum]|uniref:Uncharacterized protein n=1 Tax=Avibacterium paragallinarum TaxID=728 RepID=A0ABU7QL87_AVIPA|nr:hypothetical protein [Avibacterium paragallinarum]WAL56743.1 hypothetical protein OY678_12645 [Avibacterium paragallinarum]WAM58984.1 hypothetical protein OW731_10720 [Avibacterium paragallinarum]